MAEILVYSLLLIGGITLIMYSSRVAVIHSAKLASQLGVSSLIIGMTLVSVGTDIPEIFNSIISCYLGHGDIDVGDSVGSVLTQLTLVFGLLPFLCGTIYIKRKEFIIIGSCLVLSLILIFTVVEKGYFTRLDALFMILSFIFYTMITHNVTHADMLEKVDLMVLDKSKPKKIHLILAILGFLGVAISSYIIIQSIIFLSSLLQISEYIIGYTILAIGTSSPELFIEVTAIRNKEYNIAIGDALGSCIVDASISIAIGQFLFPQNVTAKLAIPTLLYVLISSGIVIALVSSRQKLDKKAGAVLISLYTISFILFFFII
ncbi:MAG: sodium:calcium antiporter [Promethearchaeota archaeon]